MLEVRQRSVTIGQFQATVLDDGRITVPAEFLFANADPTRRAEALAGEGIVPDAVPVGLAALLLDAPSGETILLDAGTGGRWHEGLGQVPDALESLGRTPEEVDLVVISHGHPDHLGGLLEPSGEVRYPNAQFVMHDAEWAFWTSDVCLETVDSSWAELAREALPAIRDRVRLVQGPAEVVGGITTLTMPGHTPGHMGVRVSSEGETLLWFGDAFGHPLGIAHPSWAVGSDRDPLLTEQTRRALLDLALRSDALVFVNHFPLPTLGRVRERAGAYVWEPLSGVTG